MVVRLFAFYLRGSPAQFRIHRAQCTVLHLICIHIRPLTLFLRAVVLYVHQCVLAQQLVPTQWFLAVLTLLTSRLVAPLHTPIEKNAKTGCASQRKHAGNQEVGKTNVSSSESRKFLIHDSRFRFLLVRTEYILPVDYLPRNFQTTTRPRGKSQKETVKKRLTRNWS